MFIGLPRLYGAWHHVMTGLTQHSGLAENVTRPPPQHAAPCYMNPISRFIYWNMNYHVEHHMFPMVPYHALPALHEELKADLPAPTTSIPAAFAEFLPIMRRQFQDTSVFIDRRLGGRCRGAERLRAIACPTGSTPAAWTTSTTEDVIPVEHEGCTYAVYRSPEGDFFATDGHCTHERALLADGLVMGTIIECPKHNGRFDYRTGEGKGPPVTVRLRDLPGQGRGRHRLHRPRRGPRPLNCSGQGIADPSGNSLTRTAERVEAEWRRADGSGRLGRLRTAPDGSDGSDGAPDVSRSGRPRPARGGPHGRSARRPGRRRGRRGHRTRRPPMAPRRPPS